MPRTNYNATPANALFTYMLGDTVQIATCVKVVRRDGFTIALTSWTDPVTYQGTTYLPGGAIDASSVSQSSNLDTDVMDVIGAITSTQITDEDLLAGKYDYADITVFQLSPTNLAFGHVIVQKGKTGEISVDDVTSYKAEIMSLGKRASQQIGDTVCQTCRAQRLGSPPCAPGGTFANGLTIANYRHNTTVDAINVTYAGSSATALLQINCGGGSVSPFSSDTNYSGGNTLTSTDTINTSATYAAPQAVYQSYRHSNAGVFGIGFSYYLTNLTPGTLYTVRLHFAETFFPTPAMVTAGQTGAGARIFNVLMQNAVVDQIDVWTQAGGKDIALIKLYQVVANTDGSISIAFQDEVDHAMCCGIEVYNQPVGPIVNGVQFVGTSVAAGYYSYGMCTFTSGLNVGISKEILSHVLSGGDDLISLQEDFPYPIAVGDAVTLEAGCDRAPGTCRTLFGNLVNFQGEKDVPGNDQLIVVGRPPS